MVEVLFQRDSGYLVAMECEEQAMGMTYPPEFACFQDSDPREDEMVQIDHIEVVDPPRA